MRTRTLATLTFSRVSFRSIGALAPSCRTLSVTELPDLPRSRLTDSLMFSAVIVLPSMRGLAPIDAPPAERGGITPDDTITRRAGSTITAENINESVNLLRGKSGSSVTLSVLHEGASAPIDLKLTREKVKVASVRVRMLDPGYAYIRIAQFQEDTGMEIKKKLAKVKGKQEAWRGAVLDLRSNPGGLLTSAVEISDEFLDQGTIVSTRGRLKQTDLSFS